MRKPRLVVVLATALLVVSACGSGTATPAPASSAASSAPTVEATAAPSAAATAAATEAAASVAATAPAAACKPGGTFRIARQDEPPQLIPWRSGGNGSIFFQMQIYDQLVEVLSGSNDLQPGLAESWDIAPDGMSYTFHLRQAKFSNGDPVTAEDVKFSLDRMIDPEIDTDWSFLTPNIEGFTIVDPSTIRMDMKSVDASVLSTLASPGGSIYSKKAYDSMGDEAFSKNPVGSGAFMLKDWKPGQTITAARNPYYWRTGQPYVDEVVFYVVPDATARMTKLLSGDVDASERIAFEQVEQVNSTPGYKVEIANLMVGWFVMLNNKYEPFTDQKVRQALNYATDKDTINEVALSGLGTPSNSMWAQGGPFWDPSVPPYPFDIAKAKEVLSQSSYPNGFDVEIMLQTGVPQSQQAAQIIQGDWKQLGVNVKLTMVDSGVFWDRLNTFDYQAQMEGPATYTSDEYDDNEHAAIWLDGTGSWKGWFSQYNNPEITTMVNAANATTDVAQRKQLYHDLQVKAMDEAPVVPLVHAPMTNGVSDKVQGFKTLPLGWWRLEDVCFVQ